MLGDLDADGEVDMADAYRLYKYVAGKISLCSFELPVADVTGDETVDIQDALIVYLQASGKVVSESEVPAARPDLTSSSAPQSGATAASETPSASVKEPKGYVEKR